MKILEHRNALLDGVAFNRYKIACSEQRMWIRLAQNHITLIARIA